MGSIGKVVINLVETVKKTKFIPPSSIKATPNIITSNNNDLCLISVSNADDVAVMLSSQNEELHNNYSTPNIKDPPKGKTNAVLAVMRGKPKDGCHCHRSNKHYKQRTGGFC